MAKWARAYPAAPISPAPGKVTIHATTIFSPQIQRTACEPRVAPTPKTAPPIVSVVIDVARSNAAAANYMKSFGCCSFSSSGK
jgi:hypothetical protein